MHTSLVHTYQHSPFNNSLHKKCVFPISSLPFTATSYKDNVPHLLINSPLNNYSLHRQCTSPTYQLSPLNNYSLHNVPHLLINSLPITTTACTDNGHLLLTNSPPITTGTPPISQYPFSLSQGRCKGKSWSEFLS